MSFLYENLLLLTWQQVTMWVIGGILIYLAIAKEMEPSLLLPIGFGAILVNLPFSGAVDQYINGIFQEGPLSSLYNAGIANELFPLLLFIGIGAMCDFGPLLTNPSLMMFGAAAQFGILFRLGQYGVGGLRTRRGARRSSRQIRRSRMRCANPRP